MQTKYGGVWGVSEWCMRVSGSVWKVSEHVWLMSWFDRYQINWKQLNKYHGILILLFLPVASCRPNMGVSEGCLVIVWGCLAVSGWFLSVSGRCLVVKSTEKVLLPSSTYLHTAISFSARFRRKQAKTGQLKIPISQPKSAQIKKLKKTKLL